MSEQRNTYFGSLSKLEHRADQLLNKLDDTGQKRDSNTVARLRDEHLWAMKCRDFLDLIAGQHDPEAAREQFDALRADAPKMPRPGDEEE